MMRFRSPLGCGERKDGPRSSGGPTGPKFWPRAAPPYYLGGSAPGCAHEHSLIPGSQLRGQPIVQVLRIEGLGVASTENFSATDHGAPCEFLRVRQFALANEAQREAIERHQGVRVFGAESAFPRIEHRPILGFSLA